MFINILMIFRMVEEQNIIKQRQIGNATITEKLVDDSDEKITAEVTQEDVQEEKPPSLMWRVGSGLWGASSVRSNKHYWCLVNKLLVSSKRNSGLSIGSSHNSSRSRCWSNESCWIICCWSCMQCWRSCNWCRI